MRSIYFFSVFNVNHIKYYKVNIYIRKGRLIGEHTQRGVGSITTRQHTNIYIEPLIRYETYASV